MTTKDFKKGMGAGAKPFEDKFRKQEEKVKRKANNIDEKLDNLKDTTDFIIDDLSSIQKKRLYDLNTLVDIAGMEDTEKNLLVALLYAIANSSKNITEYQQKFIRSVKNYLGVKNVQSEISISSIENIESINDQKAILQNIMEFLFLKAANFDFLEELQEEIFDYFSINKKGYNEIETCILRVYKATGFEGISEKYGYDVTEETEPDEKNDDEYGEAYDGSDICEVCADIININENYVTLNDYMVYYDEGTSKLYRVSKNDGEKIEINPKLDIDITWRVSSFSEYMFGCGENLFLLLSSEENTLDGQGEILAKIDINTFQISKIKLIGEDRKNHQCNNDYFTYLCTFGNVPDIVKIDLKDNNMKHLEFSMESQSYIDVTEYYLLGKTIYYKNEGLLYKLNLCDGSIEKICEIVNSTYGFLDSDKTSHYKNKLFTFDRGLYNDEFGFRYIDIANPKVIRIEAITDNAEEIYAFVKYGNVFYVKLDSNMSIRKYDVITGESMVILESSQCADSYTTGVIKKITHYHMIGSKPQVVGRWLYYLGRNSKKVRKISIDAKMGQSEEILIDGKPVHRYI